MRAMAAELALGTRIRRARERRRWTQQQLANALRVSVRTVNDWENDRTQPRNSLGALEDVLGTRLDAPGSEPDIPESLRRQVAALTPRQREWMIAWLTEELRQRPPEGDGKPHRAEA